MSIYNVRDYGAKGDGQQLDTSQIQKAIDVCDQNGGGTVYFPAGKYLTGTLYLCSNLILELDMGAVLLATEDTSLYPNNTHQQRYDFHANMDRCWLFAENKENIRIVGTGKIDGQSFKFSNDQDKSRPVTMRFLNCSGLYLSNITLMNSPSWTTSFINCEDIFINRVDINTRQNYNGNGLVFDACRNVCVSDCMLDCSDDAICIQSSELNNPCKNISIQNCIVSSDYAAIKVGMLSLGEICDIVVNNCVFHDMGCSGIKIQSSEGGKIHHLMFGNIIMRNAPRPIFITLKKHRVGRNTPLSVPDSGEVSNITFNNFQISQLNSLCFDNAEGIIIDGMKHHKIEHICFNHIEYEAVGGYEDYQEREVPNEDEVRGEYHLYEGALPASVAFVRNSHDVIFNNFRVSYCKPDCRKPLVAVDSTQIGNL